MRLFLFLFIIFSCSVFAAGQPAKVVSVIPVKFNGKGLHAPVPYNQQMMQRGWASVPAIAVPLSGGTPRYQPVRIAKPNLIRTLSRMGHQAARMSPAGKIALAAYGAYEANCTSQLFTSFCVDGDVLTSTYDPNDAKPPKLEENWCYLNTICAPTPQEAINLGVEHFLKGQSASTSTLQLSPSLISLTTTIGTSSASGSLKYTVTRSEYRCQGIPCEMTWVTLSTTTSTQGINVARSATQNPVCPPDAFPDHKIPVGTGISLTCHKPLNTYSQDPLTPEWLDAEYAKNPNPINDSDIGLDDFVDWETGAPYPDLFDNPTFDPVSPTFAEVAESIANGTVQSANPNGPHYVPAEMMPNLLVQINNWHEGNTFIDLYTGKTITPESPPPEETPIDWSKFPGITKAQYEASNNAWGNQAIQGQNIQTEVDKLTQEQQKLSDFIETPLPDFAGQPKLLDFVTLPTGGGCRGFTLSVSLQGQAKQINVDQHCPPYNDWGQPVVSWLLSIYTLLLCFRIFHRTLEVS